MRIYSNGKFIEFSGGGSSGGVPVGTIVIWSGTAGDIPSGWALCDGQDGRPDLRDKFVLGAGTEHAVGSSGGEETHTLTVEEMPEHTHSAYYSRSTTSGTSSPRLTDVNSAAGSFQTSGAGGSQPHNNMPPYYVLCYIIKTAEGSGGGTGENSSGEGNPIGTVINFMGTSAPKDYLVCDGAEYSISQYPDLAAFFEAQFGTKNHFGGDGTTFFAVPDMRNLFLRGYHGGAEEQRSGEIGVRQEGTEVPYTYLASPGGVGTVLTTPVKNDGAVNNVIDGSDLTTLVDETPNNNSKYFYSQTAQGTANFRMAYKQTYRPVNTAVLYCIKAVESASGGNSSGDVYSTEETRIGTWIDGKPLYRKTIVAQTGNKLSATSNDINELCDLSNLNIETLSSLNATSLTYSGQVWITPPTTVNYANNYSMTLFIDTNSILKERHTIAQYNNCPLYVTITYTKTTDEPVKIPIAALFFPEEIAEMREAGVGETIG